VGNGRYRAGGQEWRAFVANLELDAGRPILDKTGLSGQFDITLPRAGATAALPSSVARWVNELRVLKHLSPEATEAVRLTDAGFTPVNPTLESTILGEIGWPP